MKRLFLFAFSLILCAPPAFSGQQAGPAFSLKRITQDRAGGGDATISSDGKRFLTSSRRSGNWDIWMYDIPTVRWTQLTNDPADDFEGRLSPDGKRVVFCSTRAGQKDIFLLTIETGEVKRLTTSEDDDEYPDWSPDGRQIAYTGGPWGKRDFFLISAEGGKPRRITTKSGGAGACSFEPGGQSLVCHRYDLGSGDLIRLWLEDGEITPLTISSAWDYKPMTSADGRWIAFSRSEEGPSHIWMMPATGGKPWQLTNSVYSDRWPTWSLTGNKLLFHRVVEQGIAVKSLDIKTGKVRTLVGEDEHPWQAAYDPRSERLVYCSQEGEQKILKILDLRTDKSRALDTGPGEASFPRWSPDGQMIAFVGKRGSRWDINIIRTDGTGRAALTENVPDLHGMEGPIDWSPDSRKIVFKADTTPFLSQIHTVDIETRKVNNVTDGKWFDEAPSWTPDGRGIVFMSTRGGNWTWGFFLLSDEDGSIKTLSEPDWNERNYPRLGRDGRLIYSLRDENGAEYLASKPPSQAAKSLVAAGEGARWPSYSKDETQVVFTVVVQQTEFWVADNPAGAKDVSSAAHKQDSAPQAEGLEINIIPDNPNLRRSPVDMLRR